MQGQEDEFDDEGQFQFRGLGCNKPRRSKNQQIYGDFYEAYEPQQKASGNGRQSSYAQNFSFGESMYDRFREGSKIENYSAEVQVDIPQSKIKSKNSIIEEMQDEAEVIGEFNLKSFLQEIQKKQELEQIQEEEEDSAQEYQCLGQGVRKHLKLIKIGEDPEDDLNAKDFTLQDMSFEEYKKLIRRNREEPTKKYLSKEERERDKQFSQGYGMGYKILQQMGYDLSKGLGKNERGVQNPVEATFKTAFTTEDSKLQKEDLQDEQQTQEELPPEEQLFQYRSANRTINNFLIDLKNKYESLKSKKHFYQSEVRSFDKDFEINNSLRLQKQNEISNHDIELSMLQSILRQIKDQHENENENEERQQQFHSRKPYQVKNLYPHLSLHYKVDLLFAKKVYRKLKALESYKNSGSQSKLFKKFPSIISNAKDHLMNMYLEKMKETLKDFRKKDLNAPIFTNNQQSLTIDLTGEKDDSECDDDMVISLSQQDEHRVIKILEVIAENTVVPKIHKVLNTISHIGELKQYEIYDCLKVLKQFDKSSVIVNSIVTKKIKPLLKNYYQNFTFAQKENISKGDQGFKESQFSNENQPQSKNQILPHLVIFPLFGIVEPKDLDLGYFLKSLTRKLWSIKSRSLYQILKPLAKFCEKTALQSFINFFLAPRILYELQEFNLSESKVCKQLMSGLKLYKQFLQPQTLKDLLDNTIILEVVMTYNSYKNQGMQEEHLKSWAKRWDKELGKVLPNYFAETLLNDFDIRI